MRKTVGKKLMDVRFDVRRRNKIDGSFGMQEAQVELGIRVERRCR